MCHAPQQAMRFPNDQDDRAKKAGLNKLAMCHDSRLTKIQNLKLFLPGTVKLRN